MEMEGTGNSTFQRVGSFRHVSSEMPVAAQVESLSRRVDVNCNSVDGEVWEFPA